MKLSVNVVIQILATVVQAANAASSLFPPARQAEIAAGVGVVQAVSAFLAHFSNPDGSPASEPYNPNGK